MSTTVATTVIDRGPASKSAVPVHATFRGTVRGEWIKVLSLRSTWWVLAATVLLITGISLAVAASLDAMAADPATANGLATADAAEAVSAGFQLGMLTIAVLGALLITGQSIRLTTASVAPRHWFPLHETGRRVTCLTGTDQDPLAGLPNQRERWSSRSC